jgi:hypothetical protein
MTGAAGGARAARSRRSLALLLLIGLAGCEGSPQTEARILARQQLIDPPQLWRVEVLRPSGAIQSAVYVCTDTAVREAFSRTRAEVNGEICKDATSPMVKSNGWALRCYAGRRQFAVSAVTIGDLQRDFRLDFGLTEILFFPDPGDPKPVSVRQSRHFLRMGACPAGWGIGDQAKPGRRPGRA